MLITRDVCMGSLSIPVGFDDGKSHQTFIFSFKKNDLMFSFFDYILLYPFLFYCSLNLLENRLWLYSSFKKLESKKYIFCLNKLHFSKGYTLDLKKSYCFGLSSSIIQYNLRKFSLSNLLYPCCFKSRIVLLKKGGYILPFFGFSAFLLRNFIFFNSLKKNKISYSSWYSYNLHFIGFLGLYKLSYWSLLYKRKNKTFLGNFDFKNKYYKENLFFSGVYLDRYS